MAKYGSCFMVFKRSLPKVIFSFSLVLAFSLNATQGIARPVRKLAGQKIKDYSLQLNDPQGQVWDEHYLWIADDDTDSINQIDPMNGEIKRSISAPGPQPRGLAWDGKNLWCSDNSTKKIYKINPHNGKVIASIDAPVSKAMNAPQDSIRGLAWDGKYLWSAFYAGWGSTICKVNPGSGIIEGFFFPGGTPQGLACDGKYLYCVNDNNYLKEEAFYDKHNYIKCFDLSNNLLSSLIKVPCIHPRGLAFDGEAFWYNDKSLKKISRIKVKAKVKD